jgi:hypothetical protein
VIHRLPVGAVKEEWSGISSEELRALVDGLRQQEFCGYVELRWPDCEGALVLSGDGRVFAVFQADAVDLRGPEALRHIVHRAERLPARARVVALPHSLGPLLGSLSELQPLHTGLHTRFVDLQRLSARLAREGFSGMVVLEGEGWWGFLPFGDDGDGSAVYYDGATVMGRDRADLIDSVVGTGAEVEVWVNPSSAPRPVEFEHLPPTAAGPEPAAPAPAETAPPAPPEPPALPEPGWTAYKGSETFVVVPALSAEAEAGPLAELRERFGDLAVELARRLDGTRTLEEVRAELGRPGAELEPILLYLQQRKWMARYFRRRGP